MTNNKSFKIVSQEVFGDINVVENTQFNNVKADKVVVSENVTARVYGNIKDLVVLKNGSRLFLHGTVQGKIQIEGGELHIYRS